MVRKLFIHLLLMAFVLTNGMGPVYAQQAVTLPVPGTRMALSSVFAPPLLKGIKVYRNDPFRFDFILDKGDSQETDEQLKTDSNRLIKYFLASLTVPEKDLWVNLSPYEKNRIVPDAFGQTEMGRDLLAQDYILKQITASVIYPESEVGKEFWKKVYAEAQKQYGTTDIPVDTFNKVWIIPEKATVYENKDAAFVVESRLKVMLEEDYLAFEKNAVAKEQAAPTISKLGSDIVRQVVIPILEKEVNEGKNFASLRQVYHSLILATWYKRKVKASILGQAYVDQKKTVGIDIADKNEKEKIWQQYVEAFKKGAYSFIKEEYDQRTQTVIPRKYFSGGFGFERMDAAMLETTAQATLPQIELGQDMIVVMKAQPISSATTANKILRGRMYFVSNLQKAYWDNFVKACVALMIGLEKVANTPLAERDKVFEELKGAGVINAEAESALRGGFDSFAVGRNKQGELNFSKSAGYSFEGIRGIVRLVVSVYPEFKSKRAELDILYEVASRLGAEHSQENLRAELSVLEKYLEDVISSARSNEEIYNELDHKDPNISNVLLKWLGNVVELNEYPEEQNRAKEFLAYFVGRMLQENKDILDGYVEYVLKKVEGAKSQVGVEGVSVVAMLTGAELLGRFFERKSKALGRPVDVKQLLLTMSMVQSLELFYDTGTPFLTGKSKPLLEDYFRQQGVVTPQTRKMILIDTGFRGSLNDYIRQVYERIPREYLVDAEKPFFRRSDSRRPCQLTAPELFATRHKKLCRAF